MTFKHVQGAHWQSTRIKKPIFLACFQILFLTVAEAQGDACSGGLILTNSTGNITSPNYPDRYNDMEMCSWIIVAPPTQRIDVYFLQFELERSRGCRFDSMIIYDGNILYTGTKFCGDTRPRDFISSSSNVSIIFTSDDSGNETGFQINWRFVDRCSLDEFSCWNGSCIPAAQHCDELNHCTDGSDEVECARGTSAFEECGKQEVAPVFPWSPRIIGGSEAVHGSWPWQALLMITERNISFCGGSVIQRRIILTAAHCVSNIQGNSSRIAALRIVVGRHDRINGNPGLEQIFEVESIVMHPNYCGRSVINDISLLLLKRDIVYTKYVRPVCYSGPNDVNFYPTVGTSCIATGMGNTDPNSIHAKYSPFLYQVRLPVIEFSFCKQRYKFTSAPVHESNLCAGVRGADACQGDSGGPLVCFYDKRWYQVGITSYGADCGDPIYPGVYTRVSYYSNWIDQVATWLNACTKEVLLTDSIGAFVSPNYSTTFFSNATCKWTILAPLGKVVKIKFYEVLMDSPCFGDTGDYFELFDGETMVQRFCNYDIPESYTSTNRNLTLLFRSDDEENEGRFVFLWTMLPDETTVPATTSPSVACENSTTSSSTKTSAAHLYQAILGAALLYAIY